jgi:ATP-binding cassette subfamily C protein
MAEAELRASGARDTVAGLRALRSFMLPRERLEFAGIIGLMAIGALMEMIGIGALLPVIGVMQSPGLVQSNHSLAALSAALGNPPVESFFVTLLLALAVYFVLKNAYLVCLDAFQYRFMAKLQGRLSTSLIGSYLARPYAFHLQVNTAQIIRNVTTEVGTIYYFTLVPLVTLIAESLVVLALCLLLLLVDPSAALALGTFGGLLVFSFYRLLRGRMVAIGQLLQESSGRMVQVAQEGLGAIKEVKVMGRESFFRDAFSSAVGDYARALRRGQVIHYFPIRLLETMFVGIFVGALILLALQGRSTNAFVLIGVYAAAAFRLIPSLNRIMTAINRLKQSRVSLDVVMGGLEEPIASDADVGAPALPMTLAREIVVDKLHFRYAGAERDALAGVSVRIQRGEMVGFVGRSGSGKTTLVDCIIGLLTPDAGEVRVDGVPIRDRMRAWRSQIGYIPQDIYLTDDSLRKNIALGLAESDIDDAKVWAALEAAQMADFVRELPARLQSSVGERGVRLSGGQRQRIGIARAMYGDPAVLVLDEATSALDHQTEKAIVRTIAGLKGARTILVIAHRLTTIEDCDRVFVLERGSIAEDSGFTQRKGPEPG